MEETITLSKSDFEELLNCARYYCSDYCYEDECVNCNIDRILKRGE